MKSDISKYFIDDGLVYFINDNKNGSQWKNLMLLARVMVSNYGASKFKFEFDLLSVETDLEIMRKAENAIDSFAGILPQSSSSFINEEDERDYQDVNLGHKHSFSRMKTSIAFIST